MRADFERREPRCRICRDESVRSPRQRAAGLARCPDHSGPWQSHRITYAEILRDLAPINEGRDKRDRITYDSLWVHAKRHYDLAGQVAYRRTRTPKEFRKFKEALRGRPGVGRPSNSPRAARIKYEEN